MGKECQSMVTIRSKSITRAQKDGDIKTQGLEMKHHRMWVNIDHTRTQKLWTLMIGNYVSIKVSEPKIFNFLSRKRVTWESCVSLAVFTCHNDVAVARFADVVDGEALLLADLQEERQLRVPEKWTTNSQLSPANLRDHLLSLWRRGCLFLFNMKRSLSQLRSLAQFVFRGRSGRGHLTLHWRAWNNRELPLLLLKYWPRRTSRMEQNFNVITISTQFTPKSLLCRLVYVVNDTAIASTE